MRFEALHLAAYGRFTGKTAAFPNGGGRDFHVIYGANEAGKSTALAAVSDLLFGFDHKSRYDFLHRMQDLRVGADLVGQDGMRLTVYRRKGRKATLCDADDRPLDDGVLASFLGGVDRPTFENLFGLGQAALQRGGEEICRGQGQLGPALFGSATGLTNLKQVLAALDEEAAELFRRQGQLQQINRLVKQYETARQALRDGALKTSEWKALRVARDDLQRELDQLTAEQAALRAEKARLERIRRSLPSIQKRRRLIGEAAAFADAPDLSPDVAERRQLAAEQYRAAAEDERRAASEMERLSRQIDENRPSDAVLANEGRIERLVSRIEVERKAQDDLRRRKTTMENAERTIRARLREAGLDAGPEDFEHKVPAGPACAVVRALIKEAAAIAADEKAIKDRQREHKGEAARIDEDLAGLPAERDDGGLRTVLRALADRGDLEAQRAQKGGADSTLRQEVQRRNQGLMLWNGTPEQLAAMRAPNGAAVDDFDRRFGAVENDVARAGEEVNRREGEERAINAALAALARGEDVPTDDAVTAARGRRDEGWRLVRRLFVEGDDSAKAEAEDFDPGVPVADAYEATVAQADHLADRRLGEADRVSQFQQKTDDRETVRRNLADARARLAEHREAARKLGDEWRGLWTGLAAEPQTPGVMRGWLQDREKACEAMSRLEVVEQEARELDTEIAHYRRQLDAGLRALGEPQAGPDERLSALRSRAEEAADRVAAAAAQRKQMMQRRGQLDVLLGTHRRDLAEVEERQASWRAKWEGAVSPFGRGADATAEEMEAVIQLIEDVRSLQRDWVAAQRQAAGIEKDYDLFSAECAAVAGLAAGDLADGEPFDVAAELGRRLRAAQTLRDRRQGAEEELEKRRQECREAATRLSAAGGTLEELLPLYQCASVDDLAAVEERSRQKRALQDQLAAIENDLLDIGEGLPLDAIEAEAAATDQPQLSVEIDAAGAKIDAIETRKTGLAHELGEKTEKLRSMDGGDAAAKYAQEAESALAGLRRLSADYVRVCVAAAAIRGAIARARERLQGPVMQRAGGIFRDLTGGRFDGLRSDEDEKGQALLFGVRSNGGTVSVGGMSDGTLDQLYLALRLAVIEHHLETRPALPFIADDLLVNFDDERAGAAIDALGDLAQCTQVLFFTHHRHLAEMATARMGGDTAWVDLEAA